MDFKNVPLEELLETASAIRDAHKGKIITFSKKVFIPLTTLCRDFCGYCTFRKSPSEGGRYLTPDEVLNIARRGEKLGCKEALFSLGDKPELLYDEARVQLKVLGCETTLEYLKKMCELVLSETTLLPHLNPGIMTYEDMQELKPVSVSMGIMLENISPRLTDAGMPHECAEDKIPSLRVQTIADAGRLSIPFTTGILIGIGETFEERIHSLLAIRALHEKYEHIQEVIIQNFKRKPHIPMHDHSEPEHEDFLRTVAMARILLGGEINIQAPPNLSENYARLLSAGINDWGGISPVTKDYINPERAWPEIDTLREKTREKGFMLKERLAVYPEFISEKFLAPPFHERALKMHTKHTELTSLPVKSSATTLYSSRV